jgi:sulfotransferase family protein
VRIGLTAMLDATALLRRAQEQTGLSDFGDETLPERFGLAVDHLNSVGLDGDGQRAAENVCLWLLTSRLQVFEDFKRYPIAEEKIEKPLFAIGEGRSGTTFLHALLSVDPNGRSLRFWEVMYPSPPPGLAGPDDPRRAKADEDWRDINTRMARWLVLHPYNDMLGDGLPECERTWAYDFRVMTPTAWWRVPMKIKSSGFPQDPAAQYRLHKMMLQQCQYGRPKKYWVLKGFHQSRVGALLDAYPDARIIWTHRDPVQVIASTVMLMGELDEMLDGPVDWKELARGSLEGLSAGYVQRLNNPLIDDPRIHHVRYQDLVADPIGTLRAFYQKYDVPFGPETDAAMRNYTANNRSDRYGKFRYSTDILNTDIEALHERFAPYRERFGIDIERRD